MFRWLVDCVDIKWLKLTRRAVSAARTRYSTPVPSSIHNVDHRLTSWPVHSWVARNNVYSPWVTHTQCFSLVLCKKKKDVLIEILFSHHSFQQEGILYKIKQLQDIHFLFLKQTVSVAMFNLISWLKRGQWHSIDQF